MRFCKCLWWQAGCKETQIMRLVPCSQLSAQIDSSWASCVGSCLLPPVVGWSSRHLCRFMTVAPSTVAVKSLGPACQLPTSQSSSLRGTQRLNRQQQPQLQPVVTAVPLLHSDVSQEALAPSETAGTPAGPLNLPMSAPAAESHHAASIPQQIRLHRRRYHVVQQHQPTQQSRETYTTHGRQAAGSLMLELVTTQQQPTTESAINSGVGVDQAGVNQPDTEELSQLRCKHAAQKAPAPVATPLLHNGLPTAGHSADVDNDATCQGYGSHLSDRQLLRFERDGFIVTHGILPAADVTTIAQHVEAEVTQRKLEALQHRVRVLCPGVDISNVSTEAKALRLLRTRATDPLGFLQFFHLHRTNAAIWALAHRPELAGAASQLLGCRRVRLYQDCVFLKEPGFARTNWHSDLRMAPLDTNAFVTAWIPLRPLGAGPADAAGAGGRTTGGGSARGVRCGSAATAAPGDSGLSFAVASHRDFALPFWHDLRGRDLDDRNYQVVSTGPLKLGDVSWHHGWTLHCAGNQPKGSPRRMAIALSFIGDGARLLPGRDRDPTVLQHMLHSEDAESYEAWLPHCEEKGIARHDLLPLVWPPRI